MNVTLSDFLTKLISVLLSLFTGFIAIFPSGLDRLEVDKSEQVERIAQLEKDYASGKISPVDEASFFSGDLEAELQNGIKFNEMRFIGTHNSYQTAKTDEYVDLYGNVSDLTVGIVDKDKANFSSETLTNQLNMGIRSLEMDIETFDRDGDVSFTCMHAPYTDMTTSCYDFSLALKEIKMWSDNNPNHLPITIIIEPKGSFLPLENMKYFSLAYAVKLDETLRNCLGEKLFTPAEMLRDYNSFGEMRRSDDWCEAQDMLGRVLVLLHDCDVTEKYIDIDESIKTQAMFPMLREDDIERDCTSFILANEPDDFLKINKQAILDEKLIVRTRADSYTNNPADRRNNALNCGAQIISTDYPPRTDSQDGDYILSFVNGKTISKVNIK